MPNYTPNYDFALPLVSSPTDSDLWGGYLNSNFSSLDTLLKTIQNSQYPVGALYLETTGVNPGTTFGFGTWVAYAAGQALIGVGSFTDGDSNSETITGGQQLGEYKHTLTTAELASHSHTDAGHAHNSPGGQFLESGGSGLPYATGGGTNTGAFTSTASASANIQAAGSGAAHNNIQPSIGIYVWQRSA